MLCSPPEINPAAACLLLSGQRPSLHGQIPNPRYLSRQHAGRRLPLPWFQPRLHLKNRAHLHLGALPHSMLFLLGPDGQAPLLVTSQHVLGEIYPDPPVSLLTPTQASLQEPPHDRVGQGHT